MKRHLLTAHALCGFLGVALGAFGAHALRDKVTERMLENWRTATLYLMVHTLAGILALVVAKKWTPSAFFLAGSIVFAGSLYTLVITDVALRASMSSNCVWAIRGIIPAAPSTPYARTAW